MKIDNEKVDEMTRALPCLTTFNDKYGLQSANQMAAPVEPRTPNLHRLGRATHATLRREWHNGTLRDSVLLPGTLHRNVLLDGSDVALQVRRLRSARIHLLSFPQSGQCRSVVIHVGV